MARHTVETVLIVLYTLLGVYVLGQIIILLKQRHKPLSYKAVFNWFALAWMFLRALFWVLYISDDAFGDAGGAWFYILFWLPHSVIYLTFATLALFLNKVIKRRNWTQKYRLRFLLAYGIFGLVDVVGTFVLSVLAGTSDDASVENSWESGGGAVLFLLLGAVYMLVGVSSRGRLADCSESDLVCGCNHTFRR
jgi:CDP-diglyceride synthetase